MLAGVPWWLTQDGDQAKRLGITLVRVGQVAVDVGRDFGVLTEPR